MECDKSKQAASPSSPASPHTKAVTIEMIYPKHRLHRAQTFLTLVIFALILTTLQPVAYAQTSGPLPLSDYPRPPQDNGLGIHWSTTIYGQSPEVIDFFVAELQALGIKWVKFLNDETEGRHNDYLIRRLVEADIMPIMRIYHKCNKGLDLESLRLMVRHYVPVGVYYYELYNEPDLHGVPGGWCNNETPDPESIARHWLSAASVIQEAGGYPGLPSFFPPSLKDPNWQSSFFVRFFRTIQAEDSTHVLYRSWAPIHNYFLNHPVRYPYDDVNQKGVPLTQAEIQQSGLNEAEVQTMNQARAELGNPGDTIDDDPFGFLGFLAYLDRFYEMFGFEIPLISTEGGATVGASEDRRYPKVTPLLMAERTLEAAAYMLDEAPPYYFTFNSWLIAERAMGNFNPTWESWAWYQSQDGQHLPIVDQLKAWPRKHETRRNAPGGGEAATTPVSVVTLPEGQSLRSVRIKPELLPQTPTPIAVPELDHTELNEETLAHLASFPRPANDNGWGIHWIPTLFGQPTHMVDYFVGELDALGIRWVKVMQQDQAKVEHEYLLQELAERGIMPILRIYRPFNDRYQHLTALVQAALPLGVYYYELYNEINVVGSAGGWPDNSTPDPERIMDAWIPAAEEVIAAGGFPALPNMAPGGSVDDMVFLRGMLEGIVSRGRTDLLSRSWVPLHNYFFNHPPDYPYDLVNQGGQTLNPAEAQRRGLSGDQAGQINETREGSAQPGSTIYNDSNGFYKFVAYDQIVFETTGMHLPILSTEGGVVVGTREDPRYPPTTDEDLAEWTAYAFRIMAYDRPPYYFTFTPWLLANGAGGSRVMAWEGAAWYKDMNGDTRPVVGKIKRLVAALNSNDPLEGPIQRPVFLPLPKRTQSLESSFATPTPQAAVMEEVEWDRRLDELDVRMIRTDGATWRLVRAQYLDVTESAGKHHVYIDLLDEHGQRVAGPKVRLEWPDGFVEVEAQQPASPIDYPANFPLYGPIGAYSVRVDQGTSDIVVGLGMPQKNHVSFILTFQRSGGGTAN